jgi:hypothetical protein
VGHVTCLDHHHHHRDGEEEEDVHHHPDCAVATEVEVDEVHHDTVVALLPEARGGVGGTGDWEEEVVGKGEEARVL